MGEKMPRKDSGKITKDEYLYRLILQSTVNPLGAPDLRPGLRPAELAEHLRTIFGVDKTDHDTWVKDMHNTRQSNIALHVTVLEAKDLKPMDRNGLSDPYCILSVVSPKGRGSPRNSPRTSPTARRRKSSYEHGDVRKTSTIRETLHPRWNERFELDVHDLQNDELLVYLWDNDEGQPITDSMRLMEKPTGLRGLIRQFRQSGEHGKNMDDHLGQFRVPLRDIPTTGLDRWFDLYEDKKLKYLSMGQCRLKLELFVKQDVDQLDCAESDQCSLEDYYSITKQVFQHAVQVKSVQGTPSGQAVLQHLPLQSRSILDQFAIQHNFPRVTQLLIETVIMLELAEAGDGEVVSDYLLSSTVSALDREWLNEQTKGNGKDNLLHECSLVSNMEMAYFEQAALTYTKNVVERMTDSDLPQLFPPCELQLDQLNQKLSLVSSIYNLHLWTHGDQARRTLASRVIEKLQIDVRQWVQNKLDQVKCRSKDAVIMETKILVKVIQDTTTMITPIFSISQHFIRLGVDYYKVASLSVESKLTAKAKVLMHQMDHYQVSYQKFRVNIRESSAISLQLYFSLRRLFEVTRTNVSEREMFKLTVGHYQAWFETSVTFWLQTFKEECLHRMEKALEIDKDVVQATSLVKFSNSSVDVLSCFVKMTSEWRQIDFCDADIAVLGVTKITDTICDGARSYADRIQEILERNGYYDMNDNAQFDVTDQLCITLNNIEHVRSYMCELPHLLSWDTVTRAMSVKHEDDSIGGGSLRTLKNLVCNAKSDLLMRGDLLLQRIITRMEVDMRKHVHAFTRDNAKVGLDPLLDYLDNNLSVLYEKLENSIFPFVLRQIWVSVLSIFKDAVPKGKTPEYYDQLSKYLHNLRAYFHKGAIDESSACVQEYSLLQQDLKTQATNTEQLILHYLHLISDNLCTPAEYYGHLAIRVGYMEETGGNVTIYCKVENGQNLPSTTRKGFSDTFVSISVCPQSMFHHKPEKTTTITGSLKPQYNQTFQFPRIPKEYLKLEGAVLIFTVWSYDSLLPNLFVGEVVVKMADMAQLNLNQTVEDMPAAIMPLKRPPEPTQGPYMVLKERSSWDKMANHFMDQRRLMAGYDVPLPMCAPVISLLSKITGRVTQVKGQKLVQGIPSTPR